MKGQISLPIILTVVSLAIVVGILVSIKFLTEPIVEVVKYEQSYEKIQTVLISLLSSTNENGKITEQQAIGEYLVLDKGLGNIDDKLSSLVESGSYKLSTSSKTLAEKSNPKNFTKETKIVLPYNKNKLTEKLYLVID